MSGFLAVGLGAALGAVLRWLLGIALNGLFPAIPPGTLAANLLGAYLIGAACMFFAALPSLPPVWRLFVVTGFLGGLTTFSTFTLEVGQLLRSGRDFAALAACLLHVGGSLLMFFLGMGTYVLGRNLLGAAH